MTNRETDLFLTQQEIDRPGIMEVCVDHDPILGPDYREGVRVHGYRHTPERGYQPAGPAFPGNYWRFWVIYDNPRELGVTAWHPLDQSWRSLINHNLSPGGFSLTPSRLRNYSPRYES